MSNNHNNELVSYGFHSPAPAETPGNLGLGTGDRPRRETDSSGGRGMSLELATAMPKTPQQMFQYLAQKNHAICQETQTKNLESQKQASDGNAALLKEMCKFEVAMEKVKGGGTPRSDSKLPAVFNAAIAPFTSNNKSLLMPDDSKIAAVSKHMALGSGSESNALLARGEGESKSTARTSENTSFFTGNGGFGISPSNGGFQTPNHGNEEIISTRLENASGRGFSTKSGVCGSSGHGFLTPKDGKSQGSGFLSNAGFGGNGFGASSGGSEMSSGSASVSLGSIFAGTLVPNAATAAPTATAKQVGHLDSGALAPGNGAAAPPTKSAGLSSTMQDVTNIFGNSASGSFQFALGTSTSTTTGGRPSNRSKIYKNKHTKTVQQQAKETKRPKNTKTLDGLRGTNTPRTPNGDPYLSDQYKRSGPF